ncbi:lactosylceramide 1,3-N-acetyl-beta-D-glucosaminyltransferase [Caerostris extrusa]|uniref:Hexosyltransferase n=1 Tax=Caerostris extrusa TaxID=172846 RepID=A0AAV4V352_CAEEX|nr:lactosylceramide 1,3-N-acetyl-beta-D-glucosaminyltransferase [Caerostris extrusa]
MLLVFVASSADHFSQRKVIRETWGLKQLQQAFNYRIVFLLGKGDKDSQPQIEHEGYRYGDLVQINLTESFRNLGRKSVAGLLWSKNFCSRADFVMKMDDDILIHIPNLLKALESWTSTDSLLMCHENRMRKILRKELLDRTDLPPSYHKYEVSQNELPGQYYPPYCSGMAYVFASSVRDRLLEASLTTPIFFIEDVYLTGFCRHKAGIVIRPHSGITLRPPIKSHHQASCSFRDGRITSQEVGADELHLMWVELNTQGFFCPQLLGYANKRKQFDSTRNEISSL